jgi:hypothetical protein
MLKKYLLFAFNDYYPNGGMNDFKGSFDNLDAVLERVKKDYSLESKMFEYNRYQIYNSETDETHISEWLENPLKKIKEIDGGENLTYDEDYYIIDEE